MLVAAGCGRFDGDPAGGQNGRHESREAGVKSGYDFRRGGLGGVREIGGCELESSQPRKVAAQNQAATHGNREWSIEVAGEARRLGRIGFALECEAEAP